MKRCLLTTSLSVVLMFGSLNHQATACPVALGVAAVPVQAIAVAPVVTSSAVAVPAVAMPYAVAAPVLSALGDCRPGRAAGSAGRGERRARGRRASDSRADGAAVPHAAAQFPVSAVIGQPNVAARTPIPKPYSPSPMTNSQGDRISLSPADWIKVATFLLVQSAALIGVGVNMRERLVVVETRLTPATKFSANCAEINELRKEMAGLTKRD